MTNPIRHAERDKKIAELREYGLGMNEICERMGMKFNAVANVIHREKKRKQGESHQNTNVY